MVKISAMVDARFPSTWRPQLNQVRVAGKTAGSVKTSDLKLTWSLQGILFQVVLADAVTEHALRLPRPVVSQVLAGYRVKTTSSNASGSSTEWNCEKLNSR